MKLYIVQASDSHLFAGQWYEKYYEYSELTSGGDCYNTTFEPLDIFLSKPDYKLHIFPSFEAAQNFAEQYDGHVRHISELDSPLYQAMKED